MVVSIRGRHLELSEPFKAYAERRIRFAIGSFAPQIANTDVLLADVNGPRGGIDKECAIALDLHSAGRAFARAVHADAYGAIDRAATRIRAVLVRQLQRRRAPRRRAIRRPALS